MAEATIDELQIEISSDSDNAADELDKLRQSLEKLLSPVQALTTGNGLNKLTKQLEKLAEAGRAISSLSGLDKIAQTANALKSLDTLTGAPKVNSYVNAINKLAQAGTGIQTIAAFPDMSTQLNSLTNALNQLRNVQDIRITPLLNSLSRLPAVVQAINSMPAVDLSRIESLNTAMAAFRTENAQQIRQLANALNRLPTVAQRINQIDFTQFANSIQQLTTTLEPLMQRAESAAQGLTALAQVMQAASRQSTNTGGIGGLGRTLGSLSTKSLISWASLIKLKNVLADCFNISAQYVENLNLFNVTMGKSAESAFEFAEAVNAALGIDTFDWIRYQGFFQSVGKGFGVVSDKADLMSKNLTQLSYDISSFYNISTEEAYNKVQSGFAGELEPLRRLGFALDEATLKQLAYSKGITQTYESMTQAQKAQLRYTAMIEQAQNIGVTGDMSRTIDTASNGVRVLEARIQQLTRALGNMLMPMLSAILPYVTAFVQVITEAANELANFFGFELPKIDLSGVSNGYDDIASAADGATAATEKFKGSLAGVDQLNIIGSHTDKSGSGTGYSTDLDIDLPSYDFLNGVESKTKEIAENIKKWFQEALPWIEAVGTAIGSIFIGAKIAGFVNTLKNIKKAFAAIGKVIGDNGGKKLFGFAGGLAAGATSGVLLFNALKKIASGAADCANEWVQLGGGLLIAGGAIAAFVALGNPVGVVITAIGAGIGALAGIIAGITEKIDKQNEAVTSSILYKNGGTKISDIASAYERWADAATKLNQQTIEKYSQLDSYSTQISGLLDSMDEFASSDFDVTKLTAADAADLKKPFEELCDYLETGFQKRAQAAADDLKDVFKNLGISGVIEEQVMQGYEKMKKTFSENFTASQTTVSKYLDLIANGGELNAEQYKDFQSEYSYILESSRNYDPQYQELSETVSELEKLDLSKIDLESPDELVSALDKIDSAANTYAESAFAKFQEQQANLNVLREQTKTDLAYGKITQSEYNEQLGLLDLSDILFATDYENSLKELSQRTMPIYEKIQSQFGNAANKIIPNLGDILLTSEYEKWRNPFSPISSQELADSSQRTAAGFWLNSNEGYQTTLEKIDHLTDLTSNMPFALQEPAHGTAAYTAYKAMESSNVIPVSVAASISKSSTSSTTLNDLIDNGSANCELKVVVVSEDNIDSFKSVIPYPALSKAANRDSRIAEIENGQLKGTYDALKSAGLNESDISYYKGIGDYIVQGITNGVISNSETLEAALETLATNGEEAFKEKLKIHSPSLVFAELGGYVTAGLAEGIADGEADVDTAVKNIAAGMASNMNYGNMKTGFAWEGAKETYSRNNDLEDITFTTGDTYITFEVDGEEIESASQKIQGRKFAMANGR